MPPDNGNYAIAAYIIVAVVVTLYAIILWRRGRQAAVRSATRGAEISVNVPREADQTAAIRPRLG
ncbi:MAG: hypothetical protein ABI542_10180 [Gemmatimonadota bacterium]